MAKGKWSIQHDHSLKNVSFDSREQAAAYADDQMDRGSYDLIVTTPEGRSGFLGSRDKNTGKISGSRWMN